MKLAKDSIDVGVYTNQRDDMLAFWQETVGLPYEELLKVGGGVHQHRLGLNGSVFKLNHTRRPLDAHSPAGYSELLIAREGLTAPQPLTDPDGNRVTLVPPGYDHVERIGMGIRVRSLPTAQAFFHDVLQLDVVSDRQFRWGTTVIRLDEDPARAPCASMQGIGYRYLTVQVWDVDAEHAAIVGRGGAEARPPATLGTTARISFITDPDGNWIEVSQRASLTGSLE